MMLFRRCVALAAAFCAACAGPLHGSSELQGQPPQPASSTSGTPALVPAPATSAAHVPSSSPASPASSSGPSDRAASTSARANDSATGRSGDSTNPRAALTGPDAKVLAEAQTYLSTGLAAFQRGDYEAAEVALKTAITLHPFLAQAHLTLGKVWLVRGAANKDYALVDNARLMFEMARAIDPTLAEAGLMLDLFRTRPVE